MYTIWIGHGNNEGVATGGNKIKSWMDISRDIETNTGLNIFLSCHSSRLEEFTSSAITIGIDKVDAEFGAYITMFTLTGKITYLKESIKRLASIAIGKAEPKYLLLVNNEASTSQNPENQDKDENYENPFIIGNMSLTELFYHTITIAITVIETIIFNRVVPQDLKETITDRIAVQIYTNMVPTFLLGILTIFPLVVIGEISVIDGVTAIIGYLFDFFGYLLTTIMAWIDSKSNIFERLFWLGVLGNSIVSKITNPAGLLNIVLNAVPIIATLIAAALDYIDSDKDVESTTF